VAPSSPEEEVLPGAEFAEVAAVCDDILKKGGKVSSVMMLTITEPDDEANGQSDVSDGWWKKDLGRRFAVWGCIGLRQKFVVWECDNLRPKFVVRKVEIGWKQKWREIQSTDFKMEVVSAQLPCTTSWNDAGEALGADPQALRPAYPSKRKDDNSNGYWIVWMTKNNAEKGGRKERRGGCRGAVLRRATPEDRCKEVSRQGVTDRHRGKSLRRSPAEARWRGLWMSNGDSETPSRNADGMEGEVQVV
jgi:hypothetical protein